MNEGFRKATKEVSPGIRIRRAGAQIPDEIGGGGRAVGLGLTDIAKSSESIDWRVERDLAKERFFGKSVTSDGIKNDWERLVGYRNHFPTIVRFVREKMKGFELVEGSFAKKLQIAIITKLQKQDLHNVDCKIYPLYILKGEKNGYKGSGDVIVDIDFDTTNEYVEPTFNSIELVAVNDARVRFIDHNATLQGGAEYTLQVLSSTDDDFLNLVDKVAEKIVKGALQKYNRRYQSGEGDTTVDWTKDSSDRRVVRFDK